MLPWKLFFRFVSALVLMATGGFAAGHDLPLPFTASPTEVAAPPAAPVADPSTTTTTAPVADPAAPVVDSTTTTTAPAPVVVVPVPVPAPVTPPAVPAPPKPLTPVTTPPTTAPHPATPPAAPVDGAAPSVCAAAGATVCGPADPAPSADTVAARVKRCQDWWNSLADALDHNGRPEWATKAREIAGRCEAMIAQWQQSEQGWEEQHNQGDHNGDGHPDNGWNQGQDGQDGQDSQGDDGDHQSPPPAQPAQPAQPQAKQVSRHGEGRH